MTLRFVPHALQRMQERGITAEDVESALRRSSGPPEPGRRPDTVVLRGYALDGGTLKVVVASNDRQLVVSVWEAP